MLHTPRGSWSRTPTVADLPTELLPILSGMDGPCSESGAVLANQSPMQSLDQTDRWYRARATSAYMSAARGKLAWLISLDLFIVIVLALSRYPILSLVAGSLLAMAVLPARWFGRDIGQPVYWIILLAILATAGAWHTRYALLLTRTVGDSACQLGRAREEMVIRALTRARELEQI